MGTPPDQQEDQLTFMSPTHNRPQPGTNQRITLEEVQHFIREDAKRDSRYLRYLFLDLDYGEALNFLRQSS